MIANLKRLHSPDAYELRTYAPADPENFGLLIQAMEGPSGADDYESFDFIVCTPAWLLAKAETQGPVLGRHHLVVVEYSYEQIRRFVERYCTRCSGSTWREVATKVGRLGMWEFEDYQEFAPPSGSIND